MANGPGCPANPRVLRLEVLRTALTSAGALSLSRRQRRRRAKCRACQLSATKPRSPVPKKVTDERTKYRKPSVTPRTRPGRTLRCGHSLPRNRNGCRQAGLSRQSPCLELALARPCLRSPLDAAQMSHGQPLSGLSEVEHGHWLSAAKRTLRTSAMGRGCVKTRSSSGF